MYCTTLYLKSMHEIPFLVLLSIIFACISSIWHLSIKIKLFFLIYKFLIIEPACFKVLYNKESVQCKIAIGSDLKFNTKVRPVHCAINS